MSQSVDVGSVLGGRYKVTAHVLVTAEHDTVLDGVDQVLNRPVSILVAGPGHAGNLTIGAREVATGERHANLQILDLGTSDGATYLISNKSAAAELLDLVVPTEPFVEPLFTDTLGNEIFGIPRAESPDSADGYDYVYEDDSPVEPGASTPASASREQDEAATRSAPASSAMGGKATGAVPPQQPAAAPSERPAPPVVRPTSIKAPRRQPASSAPPATASHAQQGTSAAPLVKEPVAPPAKEPATPPEPLAPKVTLWSEEDYGFLNHEHAAESATGTGARSSGAARAPSSFPASAREASVEFDENAEEDDDAANAPRTSGRWLVGGVVSIIIVAALILAVTNLGSWFGGNQSAAPASSHSQQQASASSSATGAGSPSARATPAVVPAIASVARLSPDAPTLGQEFDNKLPTTFDGNPATFWQTLEFSNDTFAGLTSSINLVVTLKAAADISTVALAQLGGSGGSFKLLTNTTPTLDGATEIGTGSFTAPSITLSAPQGTKAQYVIISFTQLPKQQTFQTYPYGVKIAEIVIK
ncbi:ABC transporter substrate-binding protein [Paenarthrobacter sp. PH39-S1]|uniref:ABC transporter substrate-binding protein n=1 Tax=Paenarthrobacter sp. PH39-S1 TaxID=3046204 RepID=UPI0024BBE5E1|nr:ABC transporter substrate-binding protein [Paenarthrobacter sp. PH39-S1]MDJ0355785.1 ABC transporter substrate-binding protein [Paenarthrobacter sp. PH39-S1]